MRTMQLMAVATLMMMAVGAAGCGSSKVRIPTISVTVDVKNSFVDHEGPSVRVHMFDSALGEDSDIIGEAMTGVFNNPADIILEEPVCDVVTRTVTAGFEKAGFQVVDSNDANYDVRGTVERFWVDEFCNGVTLEYSKAAVRFDVYIVDSAAQTVWADSIDVYEDSGIVWDATESNIPTLTSALKRAVESIFTDKQFIEAMLKDPGET